MKALCRSLVVFSIILLSSSIVLSQNEQSEIKLKKAASEIIESSGTCALISLDKDGQPRSRAMDPFPPDDDFTIWFGTNAKSRKVEQIKNDARVTLYYLDSDGTGYVSIYGEAQLVNDKKLKEKYWKKEWEAFYPDKESDYLLIKFTPVWMEIICESRGINGDYETWAPSKVIF